MYPFPLADNPVHFSLDIPCLVAGFMGGDDAVSAMATAVDIYGNRCWPLDFYNSPGPFQIIQRLHSFAKSAICSDNHSDSEAVYTDPEILLQLDSCRGPKFRAAYSRTVIEETCHLASLFMKGCAAQDSQEKAQGKTTTQPFEITIAELGQGVLAPEMRGITRSAHSSAPTFLFASIPVATSVGASAVCAIYKDYCASLLILIGMVANGVFCIFLNSADLVFTHPEPAKGSPACDGVLSSDKGIVLLKGAGGAVNSITCGRFFYRFSSKTHYNLIWVCILLLFIQCISQLLLIPQATWIGQVMFLASLGVSGFYNMWLSSKKEKAQQKLLFENVLGNPTLTRYTFGTYAAAAVFMLLVFQPQDPAALLDGLLPDDTKVWRQWKAMIVKQLGHPRDKSLLFERGVKVKESDGFTQEEQVLLETLYDEAWAAYSDYRVYACANAV